MKKIHCFIAFLFILPVVQAASRWVDSVVKIEITQKSYNYHQPWTLGIDHYVKSGVVIEGNKILTTAEFFENSTLIRLQKGGQGEWFTGKVLWRDYHANLALVTVDESAFWKGLKAVALETKPIKSGPIQIVRWSDGDLETRNGVISEYDIMGGKISNLDLIFMNVESDIKSAGWCEIAVKGSKVVGLVNSQSENISHVIPSRWIKTLLTEQAAGTYKGLGFFDFQWRRNLNPETVKHLKLQGAPRGVMVTDFVDDRKEGRLLQPDDVLLTIDGFKIDSNGKYQDPDYGSLILEYIAIRNHRAGDSVPITLWRNGEGVAIQYKLPAFDERLWLCPENQFDRDPEYLIVGGLLFQPLDQNYLGKWNMTRDSKPPVNLTNASFQKATKETPAQVVLSFIIPAPDNIGYQGCSNLILSRVNGRTIHYLDELVKALDFPTDGYHLFEFDQYSDPSRIILDATTADKTTKAILQQFSISTDRVILPR